MWCTQVYPPPLSPLPVALDCCTSPSGGTLPAIPNISRLFDVFELVHLLNFILIMWYDPLSQSIHLTPLPIWPLACHSLSKMVVQKNCHRFSLERRRRLWACAHFNSYYESRRRASSSDTLKSPMSTLTPSKSARILTTGLPRSSVVAWIGTGRRVEFSRDPWDVALGVCDELLPHHSCVKL